MATIYYRKTLNLKEKCNNIWPYIERIFLYSSERGMKLASQSVIIKFGAISPY